MLAMAFPILPLKLRLAVEMTLMPSAGIPCPVPRQGPQEEFVPSRADTSPFSPISSDW